MLKKFEEVICLGMGGSYSEIAKDKLFKVERAEEYLKSEGFSNFRVRLLGGNAKIQLTQSQMGRMISKREKVLMYLKKEFSGVLLDLEARNEQ